MQNQQVFTPQSFDQGQSDKPELIPQYIQPTYQQYQPVDQQGQPVFQQGLQAQQTFMGGNNNMVGENQQFILNNGTVLIIGDPIQMNKQQQDIMEGLYISKIRWFSICNGCVGLIALLLFIYSAITRSSFQNQYSHYEPGQKGGDEGDQYVQPSDYDTLFTGFDILESGYFIWFLTQCLSLIGFYKSQFRKILLFVFQFLLIICFVLIISGYSLLASDLLIGSIISGGGTYAGEILFDIAALLFISIRSLFLHKDINEIKQMYQSGLKMNKQNPQQIQFQQLQENQIQ